MIYIQPVEIEDFLTHRRSDTHGHASLLVSEGRGSGFASLFLSFDGSYLALSKAYRYFVYLIKRMFNYDRVKILIKFKVPGFYQHAET